LALLNRRDQRLLGWAMVIQMCTAILDLVGVLLIGIVGALAVTTVQSQPPPRIVDSLVDRIGVEDLSGQSLVLLFAGLAAIVLLGKSILSSFLTRRVLHFLANRQALVSARLTAELLSRPLTFVQRRSTQETAYALTSGASAATLQTLGLLVVATTELSVLVVLGLSLLVLSPWLAIGAIAFFSLIAFGLQRALGSWAARTGLEMGTTEIRSLNAVQEVIRSYREISVANRRMLYVEQIQALRWEGARASADWQFIAMFPKYLFEGALVIGGFALAAVLFATQDSIVAVGTLALFLAAGSRVMPSLLRLQGAALGLRSAAGSAEPTFLLAQELGQPTRNPVRTQDAIVTASQIRGGYPDFDPTVELDSVTFTYPGARTPAISNISMSIAPGESVAFVGRSGAGKSTLADVVLGLLEPDSGSALLSGLPPTDAVRRWPGSTAYVPQDVALAVGSVVSNVALGLPRDSVDEQLVWEALERAHLANFLRHHREGIETVIGEDGLRLSGGQRQRLGIARALYTRPRLLVLDEATSSLDAETEQSVSQMIDELEGDVTTIIVAHRLSTIRGVDRVAFLQHGEITATGSFEFLLDQVPAFRRQASLMGLT